MVFPFRTPGRHGSACVNRAGWLTSCHATRAVRPGSRGAHRFTVSARLSNAPGSPGLT
jgi:hypothetical protein